MPKERWFPLKYELPDGTRLGTLVNAGDNWQIFRVDRDHKVLAVKAPLAARWIAAGLLSNSVLRPFTFGKEEFAVLASGSGQQLAPVSECGSPHSKTDAMSFAASLRETRKLERDASLHDAIYVERYSRLLPTWAVSEKVEDGEVFGSWLTGGVTVSASSFRRLSSLLGWLDTEDVKDIVETAGFAVPAAGGLRSKARDAAGDPTSPTDKAAFRLPGRPALEAFFNEHVIDIIIHAEQYKALGIDFPTAIVLHGPPGCGKTFAVERLVEYLDWPIFHIDSNSVGSPYIHETSRKVSTMFEKAMDTAPSVVVIDEMESFLSDRQLHQSTGLHHVEEVAEFLRRIPEATAKRVLVIGMTNRLEMIDSALLRRGRFDYVIDIGMPSKEEVRELMTSLLQKMPVAGELSTEAAISALTGRPLSDAAFVVREAARLAARAGKSVLDQESLDAAVASLPANEKDGMSRPIGFMRD